VREDTAGRVHEALSSRGLAGKRDYVRSLEQRRDEQALTLLVECLSDESGYLRELAEAALTKLEERGGKPDAAGALLLPLLKQGLWYARASAARALGGMAWAPAAGPLLEMCEDRVDSAVREAAAALSAIGAHGGAARIAWELHRRPPERRAAPLARLRARDAALADRVQRLLTAERLMTHPDPDGLRDDASLVRAWEERTWREEQKGPEAATAGEPAAPKGAAQSAPPVKGASASAR
jgi:HEAT repeat protein